MNKEINQWVLNCSINAGDSSAGTIRGYLREIFCRLWQEGEEFSGKRPLGNSNWQWNVYSALVKENIVDGTFDEDGYLDEFDIDECDKLIINAIKSLI